MPTKQWQIIAGLIVSLVGLPLGHLCGVLHEISHSGNSCFLFVGLVGIIFGNTLKRHIPDFALGLTACIGMGLAIGGGAMLFHTPILGLSLAGTYYAFLFLVFGMRYTKYKWFN